MHHYHSEMWNSDIDKVYGNQENGCWVSLKSCIKLIQNIWGENYFLAVKSLLLHEITKHRLKMKFIYY